TDSFAKYLEWVLKIICAGLAATLTIVIFLQVFYRFILRAPLVWSEEMALFLFQWSVFMGAALAVRHRGHFGLDIFIKRLPSIIVKTLDKFGQAIVFFIAAGMMYWGYQISQMTMLQTYSTLQFPVGYSYVGIPVSGFFMAIFAIMNEIEDWRREKGKI
ncbi:MAG: TRAP transporter small permease, partial [Deltaproteobacteria bacterium]|nr:TRAP transporter small permease [Deltaproteobacteria bacterium]